MQAISEQKCHDGVQGFYRHDSASTGTEMRFAVYLPPQASRGPVPVVYYLAGLTCTEETATIKANAQRFAAVHGLALVFPDTSPRGEGVADDAAYDLGQGAGFYVNATEEPWAPHFRMWDYVAEDLPQLLFGHFPLRREAQAITGHSMGGHGALTLAMALPERFASVSAFAPIAHPTASDWGRKQLSAYLGPGEAAWARHDATLQMRARGFPGPVLIDQGCNDQFLASLMPEALAEAMAARRQEGVLRMQKGYDHSYFFVASFMSGHVAFHAEALAG